MRQELLKSIPGLINSLAAKKCGDFSICSATQIACATFQRQRRLTGGQRSEGPGGSNLKLCAVWCNRPANNSGRGPARNFHPGRLALPCGELATKIAYLATNKNSHKNFQLESWAGENILWVSEVINRINKGKINTLTGIITFWVKLHKALPGPGLAHKINYICGRNVRSGSWVTE